MIFGPLVGLSLVVTVSADPRITLPTNHPTLDDARPHLTMQQKAAALQPLIHSATDCVVKAVTASPRFVQSVKIGNVGDLIVGSMSSCSNAMHAMIDEHDRLFGKGTGEAFFMGPYLDSLPGTVDKLVRGTESKAK